MAEEPQHRKTPCQGGDPPASTYRQRQRRPQEGQRDVWPEAVWRQRLGHSMPSRRQRKRSRRMREQSSRGFACCQPRPPAPVIGWRCWPKRIAQQRSSFDQRHRERTRAHASEDLKPLERTRASRWRASIGSLSLVGLMPSALLAVRAWHDGGRSAELHPLYAGGSQYTRGYGLVGCWACCWSSSSSRCLRLRESSRVVSRLRGTLVLVSTGGTASACWGTGSATTRIPSPALWALSWLCMFCPLTHPCSTATSDP